MARWGFLAFLGLFGTIAALIVVFTSGDAPTQEAVGQWVGLLFLVGIGAYIISRFTKPRG